MWLQAGLAALPKTPADGLRGDHARGPRPRSSSRSLQNVPVGERHRLAVLEMNRRPGVWRVWLDGKPCTDPIVLAGLAPALEADRDGRVVERRRRRRATASASASSGSASPGRSAARGGRSSPGFTFRDRGYVVRQLRPAPAASGRSRPIPIEAYAFDAALAA